MNLSLYRHQGSVEAMKDKLLVDLKTVVVDADGLLAEVGNASVEEFAAARGRIEARLRAARAGLDHARIALARNARHAADASQEYARENPWKAFGLPAIAALAVFAVLSRR